MAYVRMLQVVAVLLACCASLHAQSTVGLHPELTWRYMRRACAAQNMHTSLQPWNIADVCRTDSTPTTANGRGIGYFIHPLVNMQLSAGSPFRQHYEAGIRAGLSLGKRVSVESNYILTERQFFGYEQAYIDSTGLIPHYDRYLLHREDFYLYHSFNFGISWTLSEHIALRAGKDRHFWGDGYRSLFLSDNASGYPFLQMIIKVWNIQYAFMTARMSDYQLSEHFGARHAKYSSMHTLSWDITHDVNVNLFEAVVWDAVDSVSKRTFDINYLNPAVIFRPVEYSLGSPDNMLLGLGAKFRVWRGAYLYGQFLLDEFKLNELKSGNGWWANKYAFQAGLKYFAGERRPAMIQAEWNQVRPYAYTHTYPLQNYGHLADALAHPMGANLREGLVIVRWAFAPNWSVHATATCAVQGTDSAGVNLGANIYKSNATREKDYGNSTLQGIRTTTSYRELKVARTLVAKWNLQAEATISDRLCIREKKTIRHDFYFSIGLRTLLYRD